MMDPLFGGRESRAQDLSVSGVVIGVVTNNQDPDNMGRVKVKLHHLGDTDESDWARIVTPMAGAGRGVYFLPDVGDQVLVAFEHASARSPVILGALWTGQESPPEKNDKGENNVRVIKSRSGHRIRFTDEEGGAKIEIIDSSGKNSIVFDTVKNEIKIESDQNITLSAAKGEIKLAARTITVESSEAATLRAGSKMDIEATGPMKLGGATIDLN